MAPNNIPNTGATVYPRTAAFGLSEGAARVVATVTTAITWTLLTLGIRFFIRWKINGPWGWDDWGCALGTFFALLDAALILTEVPYSLGPSSTTTATTTGDKYGPYTTNILYVLTITCSMLSMCLLIGRIVRIQRRKLWIVYFNGAATLVWGVVGVVLFAVLGRVGEEGGGEWPLYVGLTVGKVVLELANVGSALLVVWELQMPVRHKVAVMAAFATRLLIIPPSIVRLREIHHTLTNPDFNQSRIGAVILTRIVINLSIILSTVPCAKPFLAVFESSGLHRPLARWEEPPPASTEAGDYILAKQPGRVGHRRRAEKWRVVLRPQNGSTTTVVSLGARRGSWEREVGRREESEVGILATREVIVSYEETLDPWDDDWDP